MKGQWAVVAWIIVIIIAMLIILSVMKGFV